MQRGLTLVEVMVALVLFGALLLVTSWTTKISVGGKQDGRLRAEAVGVAQGELEAIHALDFNQISSHPPKPIAGGYTVERIVRGMALDEEGNLVEEPLPRAKLKYVEVIVKWSGGEVKIPTLIDQRIKEGE